MKVGVDRFALFRVPRVSSLEMVEMVEMQLYCLLLVAIEMVET